MRIEDFYYLSSHSESNTEAHVCGPSVPLFASCTIERAANNFPCFVQVLLLFLSLRKALWTVLQSIPAAPQASSEIYQVRCSLSTGSLNWEKKNTVIKKLEAIPQVTENSTWHQKIVQCLASACTRCAATQYQAPSTRNREIFPAWKIATE